MMRFAVVADTHFFADGSGCDGVWWNRTLSSRSLEVGHCMAKRYEHGSRQGRRKECFLIPRSAIYFSERPTVPARRDRPKGVQETPDQELGRHVHDVT